MGDCVLACVHGFECNKLFLLSVAVSSFFFFCFCEEEDVPFLLGVRSGGNQINLRFCVVWTVLAQKRLRFEGLYF